MDDIITLLISLSALITAVATLIRDFIKAKKEIEEALPTKIKHQSDIDMKIHDRLEEAKEYLNADRVQIYDFHNGGHYANGRSALKTSCSFEVVRNGIEGHQKELQAVPLSCIPQFIQELVKNGELKVDDLEEIKNTMPSTYQLKKEQDIASFYDIILNDEKGEPIGFLAFQYTKTNCVNFTKEEKNQILKLKFFIEENLKDMVSKNKK